MVAAAAAAVMAVECDKCGRSCVGALGLRIHRMKSQASPHLHTGAPFYLVPALPIPFLACVASLAERPRFQQCVRICRFSPPALLGPQRGEGNREE